jgi:hypothetical protein
MKCPKSPTNMLINCIGLFISLASIWWLREYGQQYSAATGGIIITCLALAVPIIVLEWIFLKPYRNKSAGLDFSAAKSKRSGNLKRTAIKLLGLYASFGFVAFIYWIFPEYRGGYYEGFFSILRTILIGLMLVAIPYFYFIDRAMTEPKDGYWHMGMLVLGQWKNVNGAKIGQLLLGWTVKLFFLPLMFRYSGNNLNSLMNVNFSNVFNMTGDLSGRMSLNLYSFFNNFLFYIDLLFVTVGYCFTVRLFDSHIRSTEPTFLGWVVAVMCYQPFWGAVFGSLYISYNSGRDWSNLFWDMPWVHFSYGAVILSLVVIYVWASMAFGIRFSNLTHRGILTNGAYRYTKHPAYISKNLSWWLIFMPFLMAPEFDDKLRLSLLLILQNIIYFFRSRTEERHLSMDADYIAYSAYIEKHGMFAWVGRWLPVLKFKPGQLFNVESKPARTTAVGGDTGRSVESVYDKV